MVEEHKTHSLCKNTGKGIVSKSEKTYRSIWQGISYVSVHCYDRRICIDIILGCFITQRTNNKARIEGQAPGKDRRIMIYITGDTHGRFERVERFCERFGTSREDILVILGDAGINFSGGWRDRMKKELLESLPVTIFAIHGNHEQRPQTIETYKEKMWQGGMVYYEEEFPDLLFAKDGEVFNLDGKKAIVMGGAYSVDKMIRLMYGYGWWSDEQPSEEIKRDVERKLEELGWKVDVVLSHTTPLKYEPVEVFLKGIDQSKVDKSTEEWLDGIEDKLDYRKWYCGHYHTVKKVDRVEIMFENVDEFCND